MKRLTINLKILAGFAVALAGIGYFLLTSYHNAQYIQNENQEANYLFMLVTAAEDILDDVQDIETGYRGYLITENPKYLEPFKRAMERTSRDIEKIKRLVDDHPEKFNTINTLEALVEQKTSFAKEVIEMVNNGKRSDAVDLISEGEGKRQMENVRSLVSRIENDARKELESSATMRQEFAENTRNNFLLLGLFILVVLSVFYIVIKSDLYRLDKSKKELLDAGTHIRDLYDHSPAGYLTLDKNLVITRINNTALEWVDFKNVEEVVSKNFATLVDEDSIPLLDQLKETDTLKNLEIRLEGKKKKIPVILDSVTIKDVQSGRVEKRITLTDISRRKIAEEQNIYLAGLIDQTSDAIFSYDKGLVLRSWNKGAEVMYGFTSEEAIGQHISILKGSISAEDRLRILEEVDEKGFWNGELYHHRKDGTPKPVYSSITAIHDGKDKISGYVSVVQDITSQKLYEEHLQNFNQELLEKVAEKSQEVYNTLERVTDGFLSLDSGYRIVYLNSNAARMLGHDRKDLIGKDLRTQFQVERNSFRDAYIRAFETQTQVELEDYYAYFDKWYYCMIYPGKEGLSLFFRDVTTRKLSEMKLHEREKQYRTLFEHNPLPMCVVDISTGEIIDVNNAAIVSYEYDREEFVNKNLRDICGGDPALLLASDEGPTIVTQWTSKKEKIEAEVFSYDTDYDGRKCRLLICNDITEKLKNEQELRASRDELRQLSGHTEKIREEERAHIAREIHDELGQQLTGLKMDISWLSKRLGKEPEGAREKIKGMLELVDETVRSVRKISSELRPGIIDDLGLTAALDWQANEFKKRTGIDCVFHSELKDPVNDKNISIGVFRIFQEALTNVARHSHATSVSSVLTSNGREIRLFVKDNGEGIQQEGMQKKTLGILGMHERALMMHGQLDIQSQPGSGTKIELIVPLNQTQIN